MLIVCLMFCVVDCVKGISKVTDFFDVLQRLYVFMSGSAVNKVFSEKLKAANKDHKTDEFKLTLKRHSDTRWTSQFESCRAARSSMEFIVETLEQFSDIDERNADRRNVADQLLSGITTTFLIHLVMFEEILRVTSTLARCLQGKNLDLASALHQIENVVIQFDTAMNDVASTTSFWQTIWVTAQSIINEKIYQNLMLVSSERLDTRLLLHMKIPTQRMNIFAFFSIQL